MTLTQDHNKIGRKKHLVGYHWGKERSFCEKDAEGTRSAPAKRQRTQFTPLYGKALNLHLGRCCREKDHFERKKRASNPMLAGREVKRKKEINTREGIAIVSREKPVL